MATASKHVAIDIEDDERGTDEPYDREFLHRVIEDAGRWAYGVKLVELWVLNDAATQLYRPESGWWMDYYADKDHKFSVLTDASLPEFIPAAPLAPGIGLPGYLWSQSKSGNMVDRRQSGLRSSAVGMSDRSAQLIPPSLSWCEVKPLAADPDQPYNERLQYLAKAGLGLAAGVPFNIGGTQGIVIYMARESDDHSELTNSVNEEYLQRATTVIGSTYSLRKPRLAVVNRKKAACSASWRRVRKRLAAIKAMGKTLKEVIQEESEKEKFSHNSQVIGDFIHDVDGTCNTIVGYFIGKLKIEATKFFGANVKAPPTFGWMPSLFTFAGSFVTLAILTNLNKALVEGYGSGYSIVLPPFGALMTLQYGLTAAPASQPRNAIVGQTLALIIACLIGQLDELELWLRQSLATALAIGVMVKFGVTHPPAGAAALVFSSGRQSWRQAGLMILGNVIAVLSATLINNWNAKRQYPTFWGFRPITSLFSPKTKKAA
ncbi:unnamed protein product [Cylindrotheca closterium]|uniref:HPP transmembrane region domain-containing protein n=1 Tax=Cylindrotheca closterium TaxID=2856 RepID=A0AAD2G0H0_9STRA|nr:unnamed protein product [Cylindrotheca closterium]